MHLLRKFINHTVSCFNRLNFNAIRQISSDLCTGREKLIGLNSLKQLNQHQSNVYKNSLLSLSKCIFNIDSIGRSDLLQNSIKFQQMNACGMASLTQMHRKGPHRKKRPERRPLDGCPQMKGIILKTLIKKPKKPNSANRKCVLLKLSNGKEMVAYVPGIGHNLQEHNIVLVRCGRLRDVPGVKLKCIRGVYDLPHVQKVKRV